MFTFSFPVHSQSSHNNQVLYYELDGTIHNGTEEILENMFTKAKNENLSAILIQLDTPGGLLDSTEVIVKKFLNAPLPVIVYVGPSGARAGSAGTFITLAAHIAAMAPGTYIGAAHPVSLFGGGQEDDENAQVMQKKIESAASSFIEAIAKQRGRNVEWAKKAVLESEAITEDVALEKNVIDIVALSKEELLTKISGKEIQVQNQTITFNTEQVEWIEYHPNFELRFLNAIASPTVLYLLIIGVILGFYLEISQPGMFIPGILAGLCLILVLFATQVIPINFLGVLLMIAALVLLILELFVTSFGLLTLAGLACFVGGSLLLFDIKGMEVELPLAYIASATLAILAISVIILFLIVKTHSRPQTVGKDELIGMTGEVLSDITPTHPGKVFVHSEYWTATASQLIQKGEKIKVLDLEGLKLKVEKV